MSQQIPPGAPRRPFHARAALAVADLAVTAFVVGVELARPLYRPVVEAASRLALVRRLEALVARLPPYGILTVLAVPFLGVEPLKVLGLVWMADGRFLRGLALLAFAYLASFVLVERIYHAGREKLLGIGWFALCVAFVCEIRSRVMDRVRATAAWRSGAALAADARALAARWLAYARA